MRTSRASTHGGRRSRHAAILIGCLLVLLAALPAPAQDLANFQLFQSGFIGPAYLGSPPGEPNRIMIAELRGVIRVIENGVLLPTPFLDNTVRTYPDHGLIGVAFPPDYATSRRFYINYTAQGFGGPRIARYTTSANPNIANTTEEDLLHTGAGLGDHDAGWMDFGLDGYLYIARGDADGNPQDPNVFQGKILRLDVSPATGYTVPPDNPFVGIPGLDEIAALGVRNPWRDGFDPLTGDLYIADVGLSTMEEIDYVPAGTIAGRNFGWPCIEGTSCHDSVPPCTCSSPPLTAPIHTYGRGTGVTVIGGTVYRGNAIPRWRGRYFFLDNGSNRIWSFRVVGGVKTDLQEHTAALNGGISPLRFGVSFGTDGDGELYVVERAGRILKIVPQFAPADWDLDGVVNSADFFAFVNDYFAGHADLDGDQATTVADFFEYLDLFFGG
jgi:glucose/arabinose dehydrogenase